MAAPAATASTSCLSFEHVQDFMRSTDRMEEIRRPVVHIKGFGQGVDSTPENEALLNIYVKSIFESNPGTVAWDGDNFNLRGFTAAVPLLLQEYLRQNKPLPKLLMFRFEHECNAEFVKGWETALEEFHAGAQVLLVDKDKAREAEDQRREEERGLRAASTTGAALYTWEQAQSWEKEYAILGMEAMRLTQGESVICYGGGNVLLMEVDADMQRRSWPGWEGPQREWKVVPATRAKKNGAPGERESSRLAQVEGVVVVGPAQ